MNPRHTNTFHKGMYQDGDALNQPAGTYRNSINGRLVFNDNGTLSWENDLGNSRLFNIHTYGNTTVPLYPVGWIKLNDTLVIFSTNFTDSEIGIATIDPNTLVVSYQTVFNDFYDPNGDRLGFSIEHEIRGRGIYENDQTQRVYWTDRYHEPCSFNVVLGKQSVSPEFTSGDYVPSVAGPSHSIYPSFYSVASMKRQPDCIFATFKFTNLISGSKKCGTYQYLHRYLNRDGGASPWSPISRHLFITTSSPDGTNQGNYQMDASDINTSHGIQFDLEGLDTRWDKVEVAFSYMKTPFVNGALTSFLTVPVPASGTLTIQDPGMGGRAMTFDEANTHYTSVKTVNDINTKDNRLIEAGITVGGEIKASLTNRSATPYMKLMLGDEHTSTDKSLPFVHYSLYTTTTKKQLFLDSSSTPVKEEYQINNDYLNYKGMQLEHLYSGHFRGEWYRYGLLFLDLKGNPTFVQHLFDLKYPEQYSNQYTIRYLDDNGNTVTTTATSGSAGDYVLTGDGFDLAWETINPSAAIRTRVLGVKIGGIDITSIIDQISGVMIVRAERDPTILGQGFLMNTVFEPVGDGDTTRPMCYSSNNFSGTIWQDHDSDFILGQDGLQMLFRPYTYMFECPDYMFDTTVIPELLPAHRINQVSGMYATAPDSFADRGLGVPDNGSDGTVGSSLLNRLGIFVKTYLTDISSFLNRGGGGITFPVSDSLQTKLEVQGGTNYAAYDPSSPGLTFDTKGYVKGTTAQPVLWLTNDRNYAGTYHANGILVKSNWRDDVSIHRTGHYICYPTANYVIDSYDPYGGLNQAALEQTIYHPTGTYIPINAANKALIKKVTGGITSYVLNGIEVWGGDCYVNLCSFARIYGGVDSNADKAGEPDGDNTHNIAIAHVAPLECKYNLPMRKGSTWERYGFKDSGTAYPLGVHKYAGEDFNINGVLLELDRFWNYVPKTHNFVFVTNFPTRLNYSEVKTYGETLDSFKKFLANSFLDIDGRYGEVVAIPSLFNQIYAIQRHGLGRLRFNDRAAVQTVEGETLTIGTGGVLDGIDYISHQFGTRHKHSVAVSDKAIYFVDYENCALMRFAQDGLHNLTDERGVHGLFKSILTNTANDFTGDNSTGQNGGIHCTYDNSNGDVLISFIKKGGGGSPNTLAYNEYTDLFTSFYSFTPNMYVPFGRLLLTTKRFVDSGLQYFWLQNSLTVNRGNYYDTQQSALLRFIANPDPQHTQTFDNLYLSSTSDASDVLQSVSLDSDIGGVVVNLPDDRFEYKEGRLRFPLRGKTQSNRLRGRFADITLLFTIVNDNKAVRLSGAETLYRYAVKI